MDPAGERVKLAGGRRVSLGLEASASCASAAFPTTTRKRSRSHALSGWVDEETGRWRLRSSREGRIMEDAGRTVGAGRHRPVPAAWHADKACKATCFFRLQKAEASRERMARTIRT
ncbi:hypothetical protein GCM10007874_60630 [Labrys miyagiensis]|uniref:Uncharacterized protein n=1 Tax=Labrys miyagiensis TaxID=346912 RepID=A0ABQ6CRR7_9HYPH|nr:hypothetical protein GCM10007874_60630 [Labrys miyagiensis]